MKVELTDDQIADAVRAIVDEEMPEAVRDAVRKHADTIIRERVGERIGAVADEMLASEQFVIGRSYGGEQPLDHHVRGAIKTYLDERVYLYSETSDLPSVRLARASYNQNSGMTRLEGFLRFSIERYRDEHLAAKLESTVKEFLEQRGGIEQVAREQMAQLLKEKFKL